MMDIEITERPGFEKGILAVYGPWRSEYADIIRDRGLDGVELWPVEGRPTDVGFLTSIPEIRYVSSNLTTRVNFQVIEQLPRLEYFKAIRESSQPVDFAKATALRHVSIFWDETYASLFHSNVVSATLLDFDAKYAGLLSKMVNLQALDLRNSAIVSLSFIRGLPLRKLRLGLCSKLSDISGLEGCGRIELLRIVGCKRIATYAPIALLEGLKYLFIANCVRFNDIEFTRSLQYLRLFATDMVVNNRDFTPLSRLPNLRVCSFPQRKNRIPAGFALRGITPGGGAV